MLPIILKNIYIVEKEKAIVIYHPIKNDPKQVKNKNNLQTRYRCSKAHTEYYSYEQVQLIK